MKKGLFVLASVLIISTLVSASIYYPDKSGLTVDFTNIHEDDQGLFGAPIAVGDVLYFSPTDFKVATSGAGGFDYLDGTLQVLVDAKDGFDIDSLELEEFGDYYLSGIGTTSTWVQVVAQAQITILEVENAGIIPIVVPGVAVYKPVDGIYDLINHGPGVYDYDEMLWEAEVKFDIDAILADEGYNGKATLVNFALDNKLYAYSEDGTVAQIAKKGNYIIALTIPEPGTLVLLGIGGLLLRKRR